eukprot:GHVN01074523.1.p1 GENE.GHVN01074523.1~~GHVN01074523.1.p1  ORF type:complete len:116 (+),score=27.97 GHVN01074523.1:258-605(+)
MALPRCLLLTSLLRPTISSHLSHRSFVTVSSSYLRHSPHSTHIHPLHRSCHSHLSPHSPPFSRGSQLLQRRGRFLVTLLSSSTFTTMASYDERNIFNKIINKEMKAHVIFEVTHC